MDHRAAGDPTSVRIMLDRERNWGRDSTPGTTIVFKGGHFVSQDFPAVSVDRSRIALLYEGHAPPDSGYPTFELWSTKPLKRLRRLQLLPDDRSRGPDSSWSPAILAIVQREIRTINDLLGEHEYHPIEPFFDFRRRSLNDADRAAVPVEKWGLRFTYVIGHGSHQSSWLRVEEIENGRVRLEHELPVLVSGASGGDPMNDCAVQGAPEQGWYLPELRIVIIRLIYNSGNDYCDRAEEWLLERL